MTNQIEKTTADERQALAQHVETFRGRNITRGELRDHFDTVADRTNWKNPIDATVLLRRGNNDEHLELVKLAVVFFTGSVLQVVSLDDFNGYRRAKVKAAGYYQAIGS